MYFVTLLLEFNRPSQKRLEHINAQEARRVEMARRRQVAEEQLEAMNSNLGEMDLHMEELEERRLLILPEANKRLMVYIGPGAFTMGARDEDSPRDE